MFRNGLILIASMSFGFVGTGHAATCAVTDVTLGGMSATDCGAGTTPNDTTGTPTSQWQVNLDMAGGYDNWAYYERAEEDIVNNPGNLHDGNTSAIGLTSSEIGDGINTGTFSLTASDPLLIVLKTDSFNYQWYLFEGKTGFYDDGTWDASIVFEGKDLSHISAYTTVVPVPAAVWLFGSGLLGLVGVARRKNA